MLRPSRSEDMDEIVEIWLLASLQAHDFVDASCWWQAQEDLRTRYLERARIWVFEERGELLGFMALADDYLAALFVRPDRQGRGVGHALLQEAKLQGARLHARVFVENEQAVRFYRRRGFVIEREEFDPLTGHPQYKMCCESA
ncbi:MULTISPECIES: GNAT family N-acetyltransferase [Aeromonas]|jgi:putative acetyltransferase|uniref:GNAT family N-acetyltransferase n=1 Tax=Aeromonas popoffii TaxID=70856 RepID=A0ABS5GUD5_9GAMM|nr:MULTISPECIES: GNAT family N-acetyltransferase [Aeromonas]MBR7630740.1 GNAT family N-acetyltransferase [Aeromonas popoffii]MDF2414287.1 GNAT family N-acetyltransferase [Aeromonas sp. 1HA1]